MGTTEADNVTPINGQPWSADEVEEKYVVFKMEDWDRIAEAAMEQDWSSSRFFRELTEVGLVDFVVIRLQDTFASTALFGYANAMQSVIELLEVASEYEDGPTEEQIGEMKRIRDYFFQKGTMSSMMKHKLPD